MSSRSSFAALGLILLGMSTVSSTAEIVINEIYYHAPNPFENLEWIEIHNTEAKPVDLSNWKLQKGVQFTFPEGSQMPPSGFLVLCRDSKLFSEFYPVEPFAEFKGKLNNGGETIELVNEKGTLADTVTYDDESPWPNAPDGHSPSLERIVASASGTNPLNWAPSRLPITDTKPTGSPGKGNDSSGTQLRIPVRLSATTPIAGQGIRVTATASLGETSLSSVELGYQIVTPGKIGKETWLPMEREHDRYSAEIPGQGAGTLVRYRVAFNTTRGSSIHYPHPNEIRPAHSIYVPSSESSSELPQVHLINTRVEDTQILGKQLDSLLHQSSGGMSFSRESMMARFQVTNALNAVSKGWFQIAMDAESQFSAESLTAIQEAFEQADQAKRQLFRRIDTDSSVADQGTQEIRAQLRSGLTPHLSSKQLHALFHSSGGRNRPGPEQAIAQTFPLEDDWMSITVNIKPQGTRFAELRAAFQKASQGRDDLAKNFRPTRNFREDLANQTKPIRDELDTVLNVRITHLLENARRSQGSPIRPNFDGIERRPPSGASALVVTHGGNSQVFDFINISTRSAGFKVRLHGDRRYNDMKTLNIIYEYNDRFVLAEPLAFDLYRKAGSPACLTEFVGLNVNGKAGGYHLLFEHINGSFLERNKLPTDGDLYKILWWGRNIEDGHQRKGDWNGGHDELLELIEKLNQSQGSEQWQVIEKHFDVQQVATYFAINTVLSHWDGFFNNHFSYRNPENGKWMMFPWDQDKTWGFYDNLPAGKDFTDMPLSFGMEGDRPPAGPQGMRNSWWRPGGHFSRPLLANQTFRKIFLRETKRILETIYTEKDYFPVMDALAEQLKPEVAQRAKLVGEPVEIALKRLQSNIDSLKRHLSKRRAFLLDQEELKSL